MPTDLDNVRFGRFGETAMWILVSLMSGPAGASRLIDQVRQLDGQVGPGALFGAVARLERRGLIERIVNVEGRPTYRLPQRWPSARVAQTEGSFR